jgi:membrane-associated phospholipid phosphatase
MYARIFAALVVAGWATGAAAQTTAPSSGVIALHDAQTQADVLEEQPSDDAPPLAIDSKPSRGFFSSFGHNAVDDVKHIPRRNSLYWLGAGVGLALAVHPADDTLNGRLKNDHRVFVGGAVIGEMPTILGLAALTYTVGRMSDRPRAEHLGMDLLEATALSEGIVQVTKQAIRRDRPIQKSGALPSTGYSMPSGHASLTFAAATVLQQHLGYKAGLPTYLIASYVAMSRLHDNVHYASDVAMGAATGIIIGRSVTWHGRNFYGQLQPTPGGVALVMATR